MNDRPASHRASRKKDHPMRWITLTLATAVALALAAGLILTLDKSLGSDVAATTTAGARQAASNVCRDAVRQQLKAPATARWSGETVVLDGADPRVQGYVDAQNGFGALVRLTYSCRPNTSGSGINALVSQAD